MEQTNQPAVPVIVLDRRQNMIFNLLNIILYSMVIVALLAAIFGALVLKQYGFLAAAMVLPLLLIGPLRKVLIVEFSQLAGKKHQASVGSEGVLIDGELRWRWSELLYCHLEQNTPRFTVWTQQDQVFRLVQASKAQPDELFETLKDSLRQTLADANPEALKQPWL